MHKLNNFGFLDGKLVAISGGTGLAGSAVARLLCSSYSAKVRLIARSTSDSQGSGKATEFRQYDLLKRVGDGNPFEGADVAVLCAAVTAGVKGTSSNHANQLLDNVSIDINSLDLAVEAGVSRIIFVGTASSYQEFEGFVSEDDLDWSRDPASAHFGVGWAKRISERYCKRLHDETDVEFAILRLANIYGPRAKFDEATSNFIPALIKKAASRMDPFIVWGSPEVKRDILYVDDFAYAVALCLDVQELGFNTYNAGSGTVVSVGEVVEKVLTASGHHPNKLQFENRGGSPLQFRGLDCRKIEAELGWVGTTSVDVGIKATADWWLSNRKTWKR